MIVANQGRYEGDTLNTKEPRHTSPVAGFFS